MGNKPLIAQSTINRSRSGFCAFSLSTTYPSVNDVIRDTDWGGIIASINLGASPSMTISSVCPTTGRDLVWVLQPLYQQMNCEINYDIFAFVYIRHLIFEGASITGHMIMFVQLASSENVAGYTAIPSAPGWSLRTQIIAANFNASTPAPGSITTEMLAQGAVTTEKIADNAVVGEKIANLAVTNAKLGSGAVNASKITDKSITGAKFADNTIPTGAIMNAAVTLPKLAAGVLPSVVQTTGTSTTAVMSQDAATKLFAPKA